MYIIIVRSFEQFWFNKSLLQVYIDLNSDHFFYFIVNIKYFRVLFTYKVTNIFGRVAGIDKKFTSEFWAIAAK